MKCKIVIPVILKDDFIEISKEIAMPFTPCIGMSISLKSEVFDDMLRCIAIDYLEPEDTLEIHIDDYDIRTTETTIREFMKEGWTLRSQDQ